ncbi:MAG: hypothetical protein KKA67_05105 [Spirochaetes bacterium]|nr:hypothetical protein [Spirochaetota bacterium]MBU1080014.1 hypothetical protein [Spirochaetota bacterium]
MQTHADLHAQYENETASINQFAQARMGLKPGQTSVKIDTYNIVCVPYRLSMNGAVLIASFSREELAFFQRYVNGLAGLTLIFQPASAQNPLKIFARCFLKSVSTMQGRESIGLLDVAFKPCPPDLLSILVDHFMLLDRLKVEYDDYKGKSISVNPDSAKAMGYNNYAMLVYDGTQTKVALFALASDSLDFLVPMNGPVLEQDRPVQMKLFFQSFQFTVPGSLSSVARLQNGVQKVRATIRFSCELVSIIEQYRFSERFSAKAAPPPAQPS